MRATRSPPFDRSNNRPGSSALDGLIRSEDLLHKRANGIFASTICQHTSHIRSTVKQSSVYRLGQLFVTQASRFKAFRDLFVFLSAWALAIALHAMFMVVTLAGFTDHF
jgi:hypothetical protein